MSKRNVTHQPNVNFSGSVAANTGAALAGILFFALFFPYYFLESRYEDLTLTEKLSACLLFNMAMSYGMKTIGLYEGTGQLFFCLHYDHWVSSWIHFIFWFTYFLIIHSNMETNVRMSVFQTSEDASADDNIVILGENF